MRRVLVPLDGTALALSILPDARRLAGRDGTLILIHDAGSHSHRRGESDHTEVTTVPEATAYLNHVADELRSKGVRVEVHTLAMIHPARAIDVAVELYKADMIACATHGRSPSGRLLRGGVVWNALAHSTVPVLLRNALATRIRGSIFTQPRRIMVPLDGSQYAETALPLARELAADWNAEVMLTRVVATLPQPMTVFGSRNAWRYEFQREVSDATDYLDRVASTFPGGVQTSVLQGGVIEELVSCAEHADITDIVMASHGHTGLVRVIVGSVADELVHRLHLPIVIIPSMAARRVLPVPSAEEKPKLVSVP